MGKKVRMTMKKGPASEPQCYYSCNLCGAFAVDEVAMSSHHSKRHEFKTTRARPPAGGKQTPWSTKKLGKLRVRLTQEDIVKEDKKKQSVPSSSSKGDDDDDEDLIQLCVHCGSEIPSSSEEIHSCELMSDEMKKKLEEPLPPPHPALGITAALRRTIIGLSTRHSKEVPTTTTKSSSKPRGLDDDDDDEVKVVCVRKADCLVLTNCRRRKLLYKLVKQLKDMEEENGSSCFPLKDQTIRFGKMVLKKKMCTRKTKDGTNEEIEDEVTIIYDSTESDKNTARSTKEDKLKIKIRLPQSMISSGTVSAKTLSSILIKKLKLKMPDAEKGGRDRITMHQLKFPAKKHKDKRLHSHVPLWGHPSPVQDNPFQDVNYVDDAFNDDEEFFSYFQSPPLTSVSAESDTPSFPQLCSECGSDILSETDQLHHECRLNDDMKKKIEEPLPPPPPCLPASALLKTVGLPTHSSPKKATVVEPESADDVDSDVEVLEVKNAPVLKVNHLSSPPPRLPSSALPRPRPRPPISFQFTEPVAAPGKKTTKPGKSNNVAKDVTIQSLLQQTGCRETQGVPSSRFPVPHTRTRRLIYDPSPELNTNKHTIVHEKRGRGRPRKTSSIFTKAIRNEFTPVPSSTAQYNHNRDKPAAINSSVGPLLKCSLCPGTYLQNTEMLDGHNILWHGSEWANAQREKRQLDQQDRRCPFCSSIVPGSKENFQAHATTCNTTTGMMAWCNFPNGLSHGSTVKYTVRLWCSTPACGFNVFSLVSQQGGEFHCPLCLKPLNQQLFEVRDTNNQTFPLPTVPTPTYEEVRPSSDYLSFQTPPTIIEYNNEGLVNSHSDYTVPSFGNNYDQPEQVEGSSSTSNFAYYGEETGLSSSSFATSSSTSVFLLPSIDRVKLKCETGSDPLEDEEGESILPD